MSLVLYKESWCSLVLCFSVPRGLSLSPGIFSPNCAVLKYAQNKLLRVRLPSSLLWVLTLLAVVVVETPASKPLLWPEPSLLHHIQCPVWAIHTHSVLCASLPCTHQTQNQQKKSTYPGPTENNTNNIKDEGSIFPMQTHQSYKMFSNENQPQITDILNTEITDFTKESWAFREETIQ